MDKRGRDTAPEPEGLKIIQEEKESTGRGNKTKDREETKDASVAGGFEEGLDG
jgi:hypothetical protein